MTKPASTPILAAISTLPLLGCALLGATEARAVPYLGPNIVATSSAGGEFNLTGSTPGFLAHLARFFLGFALGGLFVVFATDVCAPLSKHLTSFIALGHWAPHR